MGMVTLNYTDHMPDGGLLIDLVKEMVPESIAIRLYYVIGLQLFRKSIKRMGMRQNQL